MLYYFCDILLRHINQGVPISKLFQDINDDTIYLAGHCFLHLYRIIIVHIECAQNVGRIFKVIYRIYFI